MKIYLAGIPGGNLVSREKDILNKFPEAKRLISYYYQEQGMVTLNEGILYQKRYSPDEKNTG